MLICMLQPDEEKSGRAQAIVDDGLYTRVFIHDAMLGLKTKSQSYSITNSIQVSM